MVTRVKMPHNLPRVTSHNNMNSDNFICPIHSCLHSNRGTTCPFPSQTVLLCHLNSTSHASTHSLVNHCNCAASGIYSCCAPSCPASPKTFFSSLQALNNYSPSSTPTITNGCAASTKHCPILFSLYLYTTSPQFFTAQYHQPLGTWPQLYQLGLSPQTPRLPHYMAPPCLLLEPLSIFQPSSFHHPSHRQSHYYLQLN
jgi:hypothetical protein